MTTGAMRLALALAALLTPCHAWAAETDCLVRDPSTMVKRDGVYHLYGTGPGVQQFTSRDRLHWINQGPVFPTAPTWVASAVPENKNNISWAPDIHQWNGRYWLYYSYSTIGSKRSGIGVATSTTLDPKGWTDQGVVVRTGDDTDYNAIDPCIFQDAAGRPWLSFGSYFSGIKVVPIDPATGKSAAGSTITPVAARAGGPGGAIEASYVFYHDGYYYLFVNWDGCCAGSKSTYNIRMGRSRSVAGPYLDKSGKDMAQGGGTLFLAAVYDNGSGRPFDDETGPGHVGILQEGSTYWLTTHYEWARDRNGATTVNIQRLAWDSDGWPRAVLDPGPYKVVSDLSTHGLVSVMKDATATGSGLETRYDAAGAGQRWTLDYQGDGYYALIGVGSRKALSVADPAARPGAKAQIQPFAKRDSQLWYLQQNDDGTYTLLSKSSNKASALDVSGCALPDGAVLEQWTSNGLDCQKWSFRQR